MNRNEPSTISSPLGAALLAAAALVSAGRAQSDANPDQAAARATLQLELDGNPAAAEATLRAAIATAGDAARPPLLARLAEVLGRRGDAEGRAAVLRELQGAPPPWNGFARRGLAALQDPQAGDPLVQLIDSLDSAQPGRAHSALADLGSLAVPALLARLDHLGIQGQRRVMELLVRSPRPSLLHKLEELLKAEDPVRALIASEVLDRMPRTERARLARIALASKDDEVRVGGALALATLPDERTAAHAAAAELAAAGSPRVRAKVVEVAARLGRDGIDVLRQLATDPAPDVGPTAVNRLVDQLGPSDASLADSLIEALPPELTARIARFAVDADMPWPGALARALSLTPREPGRQRNVLELFHRYHLAPPAAALRPLLASHDRSLSVKAVQAAAESTGDLTDAIAPLLGDTGTLGFAALEYLRQRAPRLLLQHTDDLVGTEYGTRYLTEHGGPSSVPAAVRTLRSGNLDQSHFELLTRLVATRSDASNLDDVLDMVALPCEFSRSTWRTLVSTASSALRRWLGREQVPAALERLSAVDSDVAHTVLQRVTAVCRRDDVPRLRAALEAMLAHSDPVLPPTVNHWPAKRLDRDVRATSLIHTLAELGGEGSIQTLLPLLSDDRAALRDAAFSSLMSAPEAPRQQVLATVLGEPGALALTGYALAAPEAAGDDKLRALAVQRILAWRGGELRDTGGRAALPSFLERLPEADRRRLATDLLQREATAGPYATSMLVAAMHSLSQLKEGALAATIALGLRYPDSDVRIAAVDALGNTFSAEAAPFLIDALKDDDSDVRRHASKALQQLSQYLDETAKWRNRFGK